VYSGEREEELWILFEVLRLATLCERIIRFVNRMWGGRRDEDEKKENEKQIGKKRTTSNNSKLKLLQLTSDRGRRERWRMYSDGCSKRIFCALSSFTTQSGRQMVDN
jgi:hypothetical protein